MKLLTGTAALLCLVTPAAAFDSDPASFRADPQAWVRNTLMPACKAPAADMSALCDCAVPLIAERITETDVASVNNIDEKKGFSENHMAQVAMGATLLCRSKK